MTDLAISKLPLHVGKYFTYRLAYGTMNMSLYGTHVVYLITRNLVDNTAGKFFLVEHRGFLIKDTADSQESGRHCVSYETDPPTPGGLPRNGVDG